MLKLKSLLTEASREELAIDLEKAFKAGPAATRKFLDSPAGMSDIVRKDLLLAPDQDGDATDDTVDVSTGSGDAKGFKPTQSEIDLMKSVSFPLGSVQTFADMIRKPIAKGIVVSDNLVIDGHHRWSGAIAIGGDNAQVLGKDVQWPGSDTGEKLAAAQLAIAAKLGTGKKTPSQSKGFKTNIMGKGAGAISKMIMANINKQTDPNAPGPLLNDEMMNKIATEDKDNAIIMKWLGPALGKRVAQAENKVHTLRIAIATKVGENLASLPSNEDAPARKDMPQFDKKVKGPDLKTVTPSLTGKKGGFNVSPPFVKDGIIKLRNLLGR